MQHTQDLDVPNNTMAITQVRAQCHEYPGTWVIPMLTCLTCIALATRIRAGLVTLYTKKEHCRMAEDAAKQYWHKGWLAQSLDRFVAWIWTGRSPMIAADKATPEQRMKAREVVDMANAIFSTPHSP
ncbi:hypothetical protein N7540_006890 [Penicillium herquei]|nr:hypothetical protein N7540_006890 [Penicillium herquei]